VTNPFEPPSEQPPSPSPYAPPTPPTPPPYGQVPYGQVPYAQTPYGLPPAMQMRNGLGTAALVLGIIGAVFGAFIFTFFLAFPLGVLAVIFGPIGRARANRGEASNKTMATWGMWLGIVALVLSVVGLLVVVHIVRTQDDCRRHAITQQQYDACRHRY
jgi:hypothetical protein